MARGFRLQIERLEVQISTVLGGVVPLCKTHLLHIVQVNTLEALALSVHD